MRGLLSASLTIGLLAGCAGNLADHVRPRTAIMAPELIRYGLDPGQSECIGGRLGGSLDPVQLRRLARAAGAVTQGYADPGRLGVSDLLWVSKNVGDPQTAVEVERAVSGCGVGAAAATVTTPAVAVATVGTIVSPPRAPTAEAAPATAPPTPAPAATWVNLGTAATGQSIALDAATIAKRPGSGEAWVRLTNPGAAPGATSYRLRIDCPAKTITTLAHRKLGPGGAIEEQVDYGPQGGGALPIEAGTVMEIAYLSLCT